MPKQTTEKLILENLSTAILMFDHQLSLSYINPAGEILFAASLRQLLGKNAAELIGSLSIAEELTLALKYQQAYTKREVAIRTHNNHEVMVDLAMTPLTGRNDGQGILVEIMNIDRQRNIAREEQLISQYQATRALVRGMAHEIKNPLGGLRGAAQLLEKEISDSTLKEYTNIIIGEADRLQNLLNRMLGPNRLPQNKNINLHEVVERVRLLVIAEVTNDIVIRCDYDPSIPEIFADLDQLIQALLNIVRNATQAISDHGHITLKTRTRRQITIGGQRHPLVASIEVIDDGIGIAPEMIEQIFYPMVTGRSEGTGLGLSIAQSLINQHGGLIECQSQPGKTTFTILLPLETNT